MTASAFEIQASGDGAYPVADFQADGAFLPAVPEPTSGLMILGGFAALASGPPPLGALICAHRRPAARREARAGRPHSRLRADVLRRCRIGGKPFATIVRSSP